MQSLYRRNISDVLLPDSVGLQKKSNKTQYLYQQLCRIQQELSLLGPSDFSSPHSHSQALEQVRRMKDLLEDQIFHLAPSDQDGPAQDKYTIQTMVNRLTVCRLEAKAPPPPIRTTLQKATRLQPLS